MNKSWKTTVCGAVVALGTFFTTQTDWSWEPIVGKILTGVGVFLMGLFARDKDVSSEQQGVK